MARTMAGWAAIRLTVVTADRRGLLADSAAVLAANGLRITRAAGTTTQVTVHGSGGDHVMITVTAPDGNGVLAGLCRTIAEGGFSIEALSARSDEGEVRDTFLVDGEVDPAELAGLWDVRKSGRKSGWRRLVLHSRPSSY